MKQLKEQINQLATEIYYAHGKEVDYTLDDWIKKIESIVEATIKAMLVEDVKISTKLEKDIEYDRNAIHSILDNMLASAGFNRCCEVQKEKADKLKQDL